MSKRNFKRVLITSDTHCGHRAGLTPPGWFYSLKDASPARKEWGKLQRECWKFYSSEVKKLQSIDIHLHNADAIDGRGSRSGSTELITADLAEQADMATVVPQESRADQYLLTYGTPYHVGPDGEDWEAIIAERLGAKIGGHEWIDVNGVVFDIKHKVGSSATPYGRFTSIAKERVWNVLWAERDWAPKANVIIRSHVHYFGAAQDSKYLAITTPALQGPGSTYGVRQCSGVVDFGFIHFDVYEDGSYIWEPHILDINTMRPKAVKL